jgi:hypothetical protein
MHPGDKQDWLHLYNLHLLYNQVLEHTDQKLHRRLVSQDLYSLHLFYSLLVEALRMYQLPCRTWFLQGLPCSQSHVDTPPWVAHMHHCHKWDAPWWGNLHLSYKSLQQHKNHQPDTQAWQDLYNLHLSYNQREALLYTGLSLYHTWASMDLDSLRPLYIHLAPHHTHLPYTWAWQDLYNLRLWYMAFVLYTHQRYSRVSSRQYNRRPMHILLFQSASHPYQ